MCPNPASSARPNTCPECGAALKGYAGCQEIFDSLLALEFSSPEHGAVHLLTVACYMIQHRRYSDEALRWIAKVLRAHLEEGVPVDYLRPGMARDADQAKRRWKVLRQPDAPPLEKIAWSVTAADVAGQTATAQGYRAAVRRWAQSTLREMQPWLAPPPQPSPFF